MKLVTKEIEKAIRKTPYGSTDGIGRDDKKVIARYFNPYGVGTWYVLENDDFDGPGRIVFGAATLGQGLELGSISLKELEELDVTFLGMHGKIERDKSISPLKNTLGEIRKRYREDWML